MARMYHFVFISSFCGLCWMAMYVIHELGHVLGAAVTDGTIESIVLDPLSISHTRLSTNPVPRIVVWMGPIVGVIVPVLVWSVFPIRIEKIRRHLKFFAGFCLVANGAYIGAGSFHLIGDCREMHNTGSPVWLMIAFGATAGVSGLILWHKTGQLGEYLKRQNTKRSTALVMLTLTLIVGLALHQIR